MMWWLFIPAYIVMGIVTVRVWNSDGDFLSRGGCLLCLILWPGSLPLILCVIVADYFTKNHGLSRGYDFIMGRK